MRILFAAEPDKEDKVRHLIAQALSGHLTFPDCFTTPGSCTQAGLARSRPKRRAMPSASFTAEHSTRQKRTLP